MTVLVCDDDKEIVEAIRIYLKQEGYEVVSAYNGKEALSVLKDSVDCDLPLAADGLAAYLSGVLKNGDLLDDGI